MVKLSKVVQILRNNWKKSVCGSFAVMYGVNYGIDLHYTENMMRAYCEQAMKYGDKPLILGEKHRRITVILNPAANRRKAKKYFEKYCAPLLYLSGVYVSILETEREGHARQIIDKIDPQSDAIVVAGGDGTLSETLTGLMRMKGELCRIPIGVLPLGRTNTLANTIFSHPKDQTRGSDSGGNSAAAQMAEATMAIIKGNTRPVNALRIEVLDSDKGDQKPVYGVTGLEWGAWHDLKKRQQSFWYLGKTLGGYASLLFPGAETLARSLKATVRYTLPCDGCNQCYQQRPDLADNSIPKSVPSSGTRWWSRLSQLQRRPIADLKQVPKIDYKAIVNESCSLVEEKEIETADISLWTSSLENTSENNSPPHLRLKVGPSKRYQGQFLVDGLKYIKGRNATTTNELEVKQIEIRPKVDDSESNSKLKGTNKEESLSIDNEDYEVRPIRVTVLPNSVSVFCS